MKFIMNGINGEYLQNITKNFFRETEEVKVAVAYATDASLLFDWCSQYKIPLTFYGRLDESVAVNTMILARFLEKKSAEFTCKLVQHHHAKVIWWRGVGVYIGSANLTDSAWNKNVEVGCFFSEEEIDNEMENDLRDLFNTLDTHATPLTEELLEIMKRQEKTLTFSSSDSEDFWESLSFAEWSGLVQTPPKSVNDRKKQAFLTEWYSTLQDLRNIGEKVSMLENRPSWVSDSASAGAQADQFLHAHYYQHVFNGRKAEHALHFRQNKNRRNEALTDMMKWWHRLPKAPLFEDVMLNETAPFLREALTQEAIATMTYEQFQKVCMEVHAFKEYTKRVSNKAVSLLDDGTRYEIPDKVAALSNRIWNEHALNGLRVKELLQYILYGGTDEELPERLWEAVTDEKRKVYGLGISALGELVGWALPDRFPPRNGRTSKALRSLGYDVEIHV
jgi:HKD family nuclease